jgi:hypothetical protein
MTPLCDRCGIGCRAPGTRCDWCAAPECARVPLWTVGRRRLLQSRLVAALRRRGALVAGLSTGMVSSLAVAAVGVLAGIPGLWQAGFLWSDQWWWSLTPEAAQPWLFAAVRGATYGAIAGSVVEILGQHAGGRTRLEEGVSPWWQQRRWLAALRSPALWVAAAALALSVRDTNLGAQYSLIVAALGAVTGRLTALVMRGARRADLHEARADVTRPASRRP